MENINFCVYCGSCFLGVRCSSCGAPLPFNTLSVNQVRIAINKQKIDNIDISKSVANQLEILREKIKNFRGGYRL